MLLCTRSTTYCCTDPFDEVGDVVSYSRWLASFLDTIGVEQCRVFGTGSGGVIGLAFAAMHADRTTDCVVTDIPVWNDAVEIDEWLRNTVPDFELRDNGSHLLRTWMRCRDEFIFSPWYEHSPPCRRDIDLPSPVELHDHFCDYLCGTRGARALEAAVCEYGSEGVEEALGSLGCRATVIASPDQPFWSHRERLATVRQPQAIASGSRPDHIVAALTADLLRLLRRPHLTSTRRVVRDEALCHDAVRSTGSPPRASRGRCRR